jgi:hypothetical protein
MGNAELVEVLLDREADTGLVDGNGLNAFQIALERACADQRFARTKLPAVFERLAPGSLDVQIDGRLVKLDRRLMEYLMLCIAMVLFYQRLGENWASRRRFLSAVDFADVLNHFPESVVPARRKKRSYISSLLSKNEISREGPYNRKLFQRLHHGQYVINPRLALRVEGDWRRIYELLSPDRLAGQLREPVRWAGQVWDRNADMQRAIEALRSMLKALSDGAAVPDPFDGIAGQAARDEVAPLTAPARAAVAPEPDAGPPIEPEAQAQPQEKKPKSPAAKQLGFEFDD